MQVNTRMLESSYIISVSVWSLQIYRNEMDAIEQSLAKLGDRRQTDLGRFYAYDLSPGENSRLFQDNREEVESSRKSRDARRRQKSVSCRFFNRNSILSPYPHSPRSNKANLPRQEILIMRYINICINI